MRRNRILALAVVLLAAPFITAGSCATTREPEIRTVEVRVPVIAPCPDGRDPAPAYPDTRAAVTAALDRGDLAEATRLVWAGWPLHWQRHAEDDAQVAACASAGRPPPAGP